MSKPRIERRIYHGWINLNKPLGISSADAVFQVKRLIHPSKIGHAGTLDPLATGVLPLALGEGTKCVNLLMDARKTYEFTVTFGERRNTDDAEGEVVATSDHIPTAAEIFAILPQFTGPIMQVPSTFSAIKVNGKRAYAMARAGEEVVLAPRPVTIYALEFLGFGDDCVEIATGAQALSPCGRGLGEGAGDKSSGSTHAPSSYPSPAEGEGMPVSSLSKTSRQHLSHAQEDWTHDRALALRKQMTDAEQIIWQQLRAQRLQGHKFKRQQPIDRYIVDFVCFEQKLIIELDGGQHTPEVDTRRTAYLESQGFKIIRFWNNEIIENLEGVLQAAASALGAKLDAPSPNPLPQGERATAQPRHCAHFRAIVSKGTYIRSLGRDMAQALGSEGYISRLHRAAVGPFTDTAAISLDFLAESVHKPATLGGLPSWLTPLTTALDDIPAQAVDSGQLARLRHGQQVTLAPQPDVPQIALLHHGQLVGLARVQGNQLISSRLLNVN